ncbi:MAG TPA: GHMP kinase [Candidatus Hydrogenedentes bacterium]|nr:GHMP kinase [Candidatus Hydrogenedentota bacterium]
MACEATAYARVGLVGNPSDGYNGKTISFTIGNFAAKVSLYNSPELEIVPSFQDRSKYPSVRDLVEDVKVHGYYGGIRLMKATVRTFVHYCDEHGIELPPENFSVRYRSNIPRHLGLAGSSALVTATLRCLMEFYEVEIPKPVQPNVILSVEQKELDITAGLQDRVIQVYQGCVYMDFDADLMQAQGYGYYEHLDPDALPNLFIAYRTDLAEGSEVYHSNIRERWERGEPDVVQAMVDFASYAEAVRDLLTQGRGGEIGPWLDKNFDRRRSISNLDPKNIDMIERARSAGACCKFTGSGGAIVGTYEDEAMFQRIEQVFMGTRAEVVKPVIVE